MTNNRKRMLAGAAAAAGAVGAYFGTRAVLRWMRGRQAQQQIEGQSYSRLGSGEGTGARAEGAPAEGARIGGTRYQPHAQPDREPIPATGAPVLEAPAYATSSVTVNDLSAPLAHYLLAFHDMLHQLRMRRLENQLAGGAEAGLRSLTPEDRAIVQEALDRLDGMLPELGGDSPPDGSMQQRMVGLVAKVRDAMQDFTYTDDDLFRINGEVRSEACLLLQEILAAGTEVIEARQVYECG